MFDIGWQELIVLGAVALVVFPPKEFPSLLKTLISVTNKVRATTQELQHHIHNFSKTHLEDFSSETAKARNLIHDSSKRIQRQIEDLENRAKAATKSSKKTLKKSPGKSPEKSSKGKTTTPKGTPKGTTKIPPKTSPKTSTKTSTKISKKSHNILPPKPKTAALRKTTSPSAKPSVAKPSVAKPSVNKPSDKPSAKPSVAKPSVAKPSPKSPVKSSAKSSTKSSLSQT